MNSSTSAIVFNIQRFSIHDGPGIRTTVFVKGCPLRCRWCHNPESWAVGPEILWTRDRCVGCGACSHVCEQGAMVERDGRRVWIREKCVMCGQCVSACPAGALELVGQTMTAAAAMAVVERDRAFYEESHGGMTISGGEPLMGANLAFSQELLRLAREKNIATNVQSCLQMPWESVASVLPMLDFMQVDMKAGTATKHRELVGVDSTLIVANLRKLAAESVPFEVRIPIVPGCNDSPEELDAMIATLVSLVKVPPVELLAYHRLGESKFERMGTAYSLVGTKPMSAEAMEAIRERFRRNGIIVRA